MKRKHSIPAFFFLYHPDRDSREFAALARKEGYDRILLLRRENPFVANLHPIQAESERSIWAVYLMDFRRTALTHGTAKKQRKHWIAISALNCPYPRTQRFPLYIKL